MNSTAVPKPMLTRAPHTRESGRSPAEQLLMLTITRVRGLSNNDTANKNITQLRRVFKSFASSADATGKALHDFEFVYDVERCMSGVADIPPATRRQVLSALGNAAQALANWPDNVDDVDELLDAAEAYRSQMTALNGIIDAQRTAEPSERDNEMFVSQERIRNEWERKLIEAAADVRARAPESKKLEPDQFGCLMLAFLVQFECGSSLNPVRGAELSKLWTARDATAKESKREHLAYNWAVRDSHTMLYNSHKSVAHGGAVEFTAYEPWQQPVWQALDDYVPFLAVQLDLPADGPLPLFVNAARANEQFNASYLNKLLRASSEFHLGVPLGSRALRKLFASAHATVLPSESSHGLMEHARQSLHTAEIEVSHYAKAFAIDATRAQESSSFARYRLHACTAHSICKRLVRCTGSFRFHCYKKFKQ
jgi:hypothetical protein